MKKIIIVFLILTLTIFSINPVPPVQAANKKFQGEIMDEYLASSDDGKGNIIITKTTIGDKITLYRVKDDLPYSVEKDVTSTSVTFENVVPGRYYAKSTTIETDDGEQKTVISERSSVTTVRPAAVVIKQVDSDPTTIYVSKGIPGATFTLSKPEDGTTPFTPRTIKADSFGNGEFTLVPPGSSYEVIQTVNDVESHTSEKKIVIRPNTLIVKASDSAGPFNNEGTLNVSGAKPGNPIFVYLCRDEEMIYLTDQKANSNGKYEFTGLKAGKYCVKQEENGVLSEPTEGIIIKDAQAPTISLIGDSEVLIVYGEKAYEEKGAKATDNFDDNDILTKKIEIGGDDITNNTIPGIYTITYNVVDSHGNAAVEVTRKVTIVPPEPTLHPVNTAGAGNGPYGKFKVKNVYPNSVLYLYQDPDGNLIQTIPRAFEENPIDNVPVGTGYYVIQEFKNKNGSVVRSTPSKRKDIEDTTPPVLTLNGDATINLVMGDRYIEYGATATDNVDNSEELSAKIKISGSVNTNIPGRYEVFYNVTDNAGNANDPDIPISRIINVSPTAVIAIGSTADIGEVGVKNVLPRATLQLYYDNGNMVSGKTYTLRESETTYTFSNIGPGKYYVVQTSGGFSSQPSNVVEVVDIDRPYITLDGPEKIKLVLNEDKKPYYLSDGQNFTDPGASANDYLEADSLTLTAKMIGPDENNDGNNDLISSISSSPLYAKRISIPQTRLLVPGTYKITYTATAKRGSEADPKERIITLAPPKIPIHKDAIPGESLEIPGISAGNLGEGKINVKGLFNHTSTTVALYNTYGQKMQSKVSTNAAVTFTDVPVGIGYYVTQTVNGIESAPSEPVNVSLHEDASGSALMKSFEIKSASAYGIIDHTAGTILVTVPKGTDVTKLIATFTAMGSVKVESIEQKSEESVQDFTNPVQYTVTSTKDTKISKTYTVYVKILSFTSNSWTNALKKTILLSTTKPITLNDAEKLFAEKNGVSFIDSDRAIHVPFANIIETTNATLTAAAPYSVTNTSDPKWRDSVKNATELKWGNVNTSFMQPLEIEMPNPENKAFARLIRENGKLYAFIQPSEPSQGNILGLAPEPGTYALIDSISKPTISTVTENGETTFELKTSVLNGQIYYTTNNSNITFNRSERNVRLNSYSFDDVPINLSNWTLYKPGEKIISSTGEIYAFVMKDQMISLISSQIIKTQMEWDNEIPTYKPSHILKVTFNASVEKKTLYSGNIYIIDDSTGNKVPTTLSLSNDGKTVQVIPNVAYKPNKQYTLYIERTIKGNTINKEFLNQTITRTFTIK